MPSINLLPEDLRKKEKQHQHKESQKPEVEFVHQKDEAPATTSPPKSLPSSLPKEKAKRQSLGDLLVRWFKPKFAKNAGKKQNLFANLKRIFRKEESKEKKGEEQISVNLLREELVLQRSIKPELIKLGILMVAILMLTYGVGFYFKSLQNKEEVKLKEIETLLTGLQEQESLINAQKEKTRKVRELTGAVDLLISQRVDWSKFFNALEQRTLKTVYFTNLSAYDLSNVQVSARAKSMEDARLQFQLLRDSPGFSTNVILVSINPEEETVTEEGGGSTKVSFVDFSFAFTVNPEWLKKNTLQ